MGAKRTVSAECSRLLVKSSLGGSAREGLEPSA